MLTNSQNLSEIDLNLSLAEYFSPLSAQFPLNLEITQNLISISQPTQELTPEIELVLFSNSTVKQLISILENSEININSIVQCNNRIAKQSFRFGVDCNDLSKSKVSLNNFILQHNIEGALIKNAPSLTTPGLLIMDMDSTTIEIECIDEIAKLAGVGEQVSEVTERAMQGELDFAESLRERVGTLKNAPESILAEVGNCLPLMPGLEVLVTELKKHNWRIAVASGGFTYFTEILKQQLNLDATQANVLEIVNGKLTGKVIGDITDAQVKADTLFRLADEFFTPQGQMVAMGDGANDLAMLAVADLGVAYKAKPVVLQQAQSSINFSGLDCLLHWLK